ncbi:MAG TPA: SBBP repeat-containing protein, partial [Taishania sp.]|nr:SBBP repeat-containing protein [Taishania sp.]
MRKSFILVYTIISSLLLNAQTHADFEWAHSMGSSNADEGASIKIDNFGNVYTIGTFEGTVDFDPSAATFNLTSQGQTDIFITKFSASGDFIWAKALEGTGADYGDGIDVDALGNVYTTGRFTGTTDFDPNAGTFNITSQGSNDIFISKLDAAGNFVWAKSIGGGSSDYGKSIALDASGNIYVTGAFQATVDFDPGIGTFNLSAVGTWDVFVLKLNTVGDFVWAKSFGGTSNDEGRKIAVDGSGNIYTTGFYSSTTDFNPNAGTFNITSQGSADVFISKLDASGNFVWAKSIGGTSADHGYGLTLDALGNVLITGRFNNSVDFDPGAGVYNLSSQGNADVFILKLDALGDFVWAKTLGGTAADYGQSITVDINNNIYITGYFNGTVDFDPGVGVKNISSLGGTDVFILKLDANGNFVWAKSIGGTGADVGNAIAVNVSND